MSTSQSVKSFNKVLLRKEIVLVSLAGFFIMTNLYILMNLIPLYIINIGGSELDAGIQSTVFNFSAVILRLYFGPLADSKGRKFPLLIGCFVFSTSPLITLIAPNLFFQILARIYQAIGIATFLSAASSTIADYTPEKYRGRVMGLYRALLTLSLIVGPTLGLQIVNNYNYQVLFISTSIIGAIGFILIGFLPNEKRTDMSNSSKPRELASVMFRLIKNPKLLKAYLRIGTISFSYGILFTYLSAYVLEHSTIKNPGIYFTIFALVGIFSTAYSGYLSDLVGTEKIITPSIMCLGLGLASLCLLSLGFDYVFFISAILAGAGYSAAMATSITAIVDNSDEKVRATALSLQENSIDIFMASGTFLFGLGTTILEIPILYLILGLTIMVVPLTLKKGF